MVSIAHVRVPGIRVYTTLRECVAGDADSFFMVKFEYAVDIGGSDV